MSGSFTDTRNHCWRLQDNVEPLLRLSHKYDLQVPLQLATHFLSKHFTKAYSKLDSSQLARVPALLALARQLQLTELHSAIMACLEDNFSQVAKLKNQKRDLGGGHPLCCSHCHKPRIYKLDRPDRPVLCAVCGSKFAGTAVQLARVARPATSSPVRSPDRAGARVPADLGSAGGRVQHNTAVLERGAGAGRTRQQVARGGREAAAAGDDADRLSLAQVLSCVS